MPVWESSARKVRSKMVLRKVPSELGKEPKLEMCFPSEPGC